MSGNTKSIIDSTTNHFIVEHTEERQLTVRVVLEQDADSATALAQNTSGQLFSCIPHIYTTHLASATHIHVKNSSQQCFKTTELWQIYSY